MTSYDNGIAETYVNLIDEKNVRKGRLTPFENKVLRVLWEECLTTDKDAGSRNENGSQRFGKTSKTS